ncbi:cupin domain-containing protein [Rhodoferax sp. GW822-FHT02A01]|uniref:cupin domain-containing protein n=1 Tax=Rhodoferax sp. GW822-FHT02A01 TaxID=3141537 RepID=UPI00315D9AD2
MKVRRVVLRNDGNGKSFVHSDGDAPRADTYASVSGFSSALLWATEANANLGVSTPGVDTSLNASFVPSPGETRLMFVTFPPDTVMMRADFNPMAFGAEFAQKAPGLAERFEMDSPGMHTTDSIDYDVVLDGEITIELDEGREVLLKRHDVCVQHGTRHAWRNKSDKPATLLFVLIGASR